MIVNKNNELVIICFDLGKQEINTVLSETVLYSPDKMRKHDEYPKTKSIFPMILSVSALLLPQRIRGLLQANRSGYRRMEL